MNISSPNRLRWCAIALAIVGATFGIYTQSAPAPILLVVNNAAPNQYGGYLAEILRAEGITAFSTEELSSLTAGTLSNSSLVILAETPVTDSQSLMFSNYVANGGRLIAMRPDAKLEGLLGLTPASGDTPEGYVAINTNTLTGEGFPSPTLPFHGSARNHGLLVGAQSIATLYSDQTTATPYAAVVRYGRTATWTYDLARSVIYTRQGNPANAGVDRDGLPPLRTNDVFYDAIDLDRLHIPHADHQMRLLSRLIQDLLADQFPLPRLWYFPEAARTLLVLTGDAHANPVSYFDFELASVESRGGQISLYLAPGGSIDAPTVAAWRSRGHEVGMHPSGFPNTLASAYQTSWDWFGFGGFSPPSRTVRNHFVEWLGWVGAAQVAATFNIGLDTSFYTWGPAVTYPDGTQAHGYITGSGLPMKFIDETGTLIPVYQQVTSLVDEQLLVGDYSEHRSPAQALDVSRQLIDESLAGGYSAIMTQFHVDYYAWGEVLPWAEGTMEYARSLGLPMWTAERWLDYTTARGTTSLDAIAWSPASRELSFQIDVPAGSESLSVMLPGTYGGFGLTGVTVDGNPATVTQQLITARSAGFLNVGPGSHAVLASYNTPVPPPQHPPVAVDDSASTTEGQPVTIAVLANDSDLDNDPLTVVSTTAPGGTAVINPDGTVTYTPDAGTCGIDTFTYTIDDGRGGTASATVSVSVTCLNGQVTDTTSAHFDGMCTVRANTIVSRVGDGEVRLAGLQGDEYGSTALDSGKWLAGSWSGGAYNPTLSNGVLSLGAGGYVRSVTTLPVTTLEASVRFTGAPWQHVGWGSLDFVAGYAVFSTYNTSTDLFARTNSGAGEELTNLGSLTAGFHTYRIERQALSPTSDQVTYYIDGVQRAQHTVGTLGTLHVYQSHNGGGTATLDVDRLWVYPNYVASGSFESCTMDLGTGASVWRTATWSATVPTETALQLRTRTSNDGTSWTGWSAPLVASGQDILSPPGRYLQYRLELTTGNAAASPVVESVTMIYGDSSVPVQHPPVAVSDTASTLEGSAVTIPVLANDSDPDNDPLTLVSTTQGANGLVTINPDQTVTYTPNLGACGADSFSYTISDGQGNSASAPVSVNVACVGGRITQTTIADFSGACTVASDTIVSQIGDGEIRLAGANGDEYGDGALGAQWLTGSWSGGPYTPTLTAGVLSLGTDGFVRSVATLPVTTLEAAAQFGAAPWQHVGWGSLDFGGGYAMFSTFNTSTNLFARTSSGGGEQQTDLGALPLGFHTYRIERQTLSPTDDQVSYFVDGVLRAQHTVGTLSPMHVYQSHNGGGTATLDIERLWVYPGYVASGSFQSCAIDISSETSSWRAVTWDAVLPAGTTLQLRTRTSSDGSVWSDWSVPLLASGDVITSPPGRYLQYLLEMATGDTDVSPVVNSVTLLLEMGDVDAIPPVLSDIGASDITASSATIAWTSNEPATSLVQYGTTAAYGQSTPLSGSLVTSHSQALTGLTAGTLYHYRVLSRDAAGNEAASPDFTFTTGSPTITIAAAAVTEGQGGTINATFAVALSAASAQTVTVDFVTGDGTAGAPADYVAASGTITFLPGQTTPTAPVSVVVNGDTLFEADETFVVNLTNASNATIAVAQGVGTILNDDSPPSLSVAGVTVTEGNSGTLNATFFVNLSTASGQVVTVAYSTADGTALAGSDYQTRSGTLSFSPGDTTLPVDVPVVGNTIPEPDETFTLNLSLPVNATLATSQATATILDTDGSITVTAPNTAVNWGVGATRTITWSHNLGSGASVRLDVSRDGGVSWEPIVESTASQSSSSGSYDWTVTGPVTTAARIRATWAVNPEATDVSNANFTIANPFVTVTSPNNASTTWRVGTTPTVSWTSNLGNQENVRIELSLNGGSTYPITLHASTPEDGSQGGVVVQSSWGTSSARVRIIWLENTSVSDTSNANFRIR